MAEVFVKRDPSPTQSKGDWIVKVGRGRGGRNVSRHRQKSQAIQRARRAGRTRSEQGATLYVQDASGQPKKEAEYGDGHGGSSGLFGGIL